MKKFLVLALGLIYSGLMIAQTVEMDWGTDISLDKNTWYKKIIGYDKDGYYVIKSSSPTQVTDDYTYLEYVSSTTNTIESTNQIIMPTVNGLQTHFFDMFYLNQKLILLSYANVSSQKILYIQYLNQDGTLKNKPKDVGSIPLTNAPKDNFEVKLINDKIGLLYHSTFVAYNNEAITVKLINSDLSEDVNIALSFPLPQRSFDIEQFDIGNSGYLYFMTKCLQIGKKKPVAGKTADEKYDYIMISYNPKRKEFAQFPVKADKYTPVNAIFGLDKEENLVIAGFFANKTVKYAKEFMGAYFMKINPRTQKVEVLDPKKSTRVFAKDFMAECSQERNGTSPDQYNNYILKDILFFDNGGCAVIAEQQYTVGDDIVDPASKKTTHVDHYYFNDLIVFGISKDNVLNWNIRVAKNQYSPDDKGFYHSFIAFSESNKIKIVYNDNKSNLNNKNAAKTKPLKNNPVLTPKGLATIVSIYPDGSYEKYNMFKDNDQRFVIIPSMIANIGKRYATYAQDGKSIRFGSFTFE